MRSRKFIVLSPRSSSALPSDLFSCEWKLSEFAKKTFTIPDFRKSSSTAHLEKELHGNVSRYQLAFLQSKKEKGEVRFPSGVYPSQDATGHPSYNWKIQIWMLAEHGYTQDYITFSNWFNKTSISSHGKWLTSGRVLFSKLELQILEPQNDQCHCCSDSGGWCWVFLSLMCASISSPNFDPVRLRSCGQACKWSSDTFLKDGCGGHPAAVKHKTTVCLYVFIAYIILS